MVCTISFNAHLQAGLRLRSDASCSLRIRQGRPSSDYYDCSRSSGQCASASRTPWQHAPHEHANSVQCHRRRPARLFRYLPMDIDESSGLHHSNPHTHARGTKLRQPMVRLSSGSYCLFGFSLIASSLVKLMMSSLENAQHSFPKRGPAFEQHVIDMLPAQGFDAKTLKVNRGRANATHGSNLRDPKLLGRFALSGHRFGSIRIYRRCLQLQWPWRRSRRR